VGREGKEKEEDKEGETDKEEEGVREEGKSSERWRDEVNKYWDNARKSLRGEEEEEEEEGDGEEEEEEEEEDEEDEEEEQASEVAEDGETSDSSCDRVHGFWDCVRVSLKNSRTQS